MSKHAWISLALIITVGVPHLAHADEDKHFQPGHFALPTPSARATLSIDQRDITVERGKVRVRLWVHNPTRRDIRTSLRMPLVDGPDGDSSDVRAAFDKNFGALAITHDDRPQKTRVSTTRRGDTYSLAVDWSSTFPAHQTVQVTITYPFLYERHESGQLESWSFEVPSAAQNAWSGRVHYNRYRFCDSTIVGRVADFGGDTRAWNSAYPEYYRDYSFTIRPGQFRLDRYGKCMIWETENHSANNAGGGFELTMAKRWEKLTPFVPTGVEDEDAFLTRVWCAGGSHATGPRWNREHLAVELGASTDTFERGTLEDAVMLALSRAHGGATDDQLDAYWSELPPHVRHMARIRLLEYIHAYLGKRVDEPASSDFARACTGNVESSVAPGAIAVENHEKVEAMLADERAAFESAWRRIEETY